MTNSLGRRYCGFPERFSIGFKPRKEATSCADLKALLPRVTIMIQAVLGPTPGMVCNRSKFCCSDGVDFTHSRIAFQHVKPIQQAAQVIDFLCHRRVGNEVLTEYGQQIEVMANTPRYQPAVQSLTCYKGIKNIFALTMITEIGDIKRFSHPGKLVSWIGMDIREYSSGGKHPNKVKVACAREMVGFVWESLNKAAA